MHPEDIGKDIFVEIWKTGLNLQALILIFRFSGDILFVKASVTAFACMVCFYIEDRYIIRQSGKMKRAAARIVFLVLIIWSIGLSYWVQLSADELTQIIFVVLWLGAICLFHLIFRLIPN